MIRLFLAFIIVILAYNQFEKGLFLHFGVSCFLVGMNLTSFYCSIRNLGLQEALEDW